MKMHRLKAVVSVVALYLWTSLAGAQDGSQPATQAAATHIQQGSALLKGGQTEDALVEFQAAVAVDPASAQALTWVGITQNQLGHFRDAASAFQAALKIDPSSQAAHYNLGLSLARLGENKDAIREMRKVVKASPAMIDAQYNLAVLLEDEGDYKEAVSLLKAALRQRSDDEDIAIHLVNDDFKSGADHEAVQLAQNSFLHDSDGKAAARLGAILVKNGHFSEAVPMLESAVRNQAPSLELTTLLGRAYVGAHSSDKAIELLQPVAESDPS